MTTRSSTRSRPSGSAHAPRKRPKLLERIEFWLSARSKYVDGLWVGVWDDEADKELVWRRVEGALGLIKAYDRILYARLLRDIERLRVCIIPYGLACYRESMNACELDTRFMLAEDSSPEVIASTIVHEATHARLRHCGIGYGQELRARVEAVCFRREIAFAAKLPNGEEARQRAQRSLEFYAAADFWTDAASAERTLDGATAALRHIGAPEWFQRAFATLYRWKHRIPGPAQREKNGQAHQRQEWPHRERP